MWFGGHESARTWFCELALLNCALRSIHLKKIIFYEPGYELIRGLSRTFVPFVDMETNCYKKCAWE